MILNGLCIVHFAVASQIIVYKYPFTHDCTVVTSKDIIMVFLIILNCLININIRMKFEMYSSKSSCK